METITTDKSLAKGVANTLLDTGVGVIMCEVVLINDCEDVRNSLLLTVVLMVALKIERFSLELTV